MKVMKFGGTSVGTIESLRNVKAIVESCDEPVVVVVSALGGITDQLIATARLAAAGDIAHLESYARIVERHRQCPKRSSWKCSRLSTRCLRNLAISIAV